jgi:hypothetical protein
MSRTFGGAEDRRRFRGDMAAMMLRTEIQDREHSNIPVRDDNSLLTVEDVARIFQVPISWVYGAVRGRKKKQMPHIMIGRYVRFEEQAVRDYINASKKAYPNVKTVAGQMN